MEGDQEKDDSVHLLEDCWFFGNLLDRRAKISRCNSDPAPSSRGDDEVFVPKKRTSTARNLLRTPSLPPNYGGGEEDWDGDDEEEEPRMSFLIRQAMPCKLARAPSTPPCRIKKGEDGFRRGPIMNKLTRRSSLDPSLLLPPKHTSKGMKHNFSAPSTSKNLQRRRSEMPNRNTEGMRGYKPKNLERSMSLKTLSDVEVQGFQDLGFTFDKEDLSPSVVSKLASLQIKEEDGDEGGGEVGGKGKRNPSLSEAWNATQWSCSPPIPKLIDTKSSAEEMKAQIKFWARAVASNVRQEC